MGHESRLFGAVEAGGTKFVCAVGEENGTLHAESRVTTTDPDATLARVGEFLRDQSRAFGTLRAVGLASFGPLVLDRGSARYGFIDKTPKPGWSDIDIVGKLVAQCSCPIGFDTDVNAAALAEHRWGAGRQVTNLVYVTVGTGSAAVCSWMARRCTGSCTRKSVTCARGATPWTSSSTASALFMGIAWKVWRRGRPFAHAPGPTFSISMRRMRYGR